LLIAPLPRLRNEKLVKSNHKLKKDEIWDEHYLRIFSFIKANKRLRQPFGSIFSFGGRMLSIIAAMFCYIIVLLAALSNKVHLFKRVNFVFFIFFLSLSILDAYAFSICLRKSILTFNF